MQRPGDSKFSEQQSDSYQKQKEDVLFVDNYGGLNTTSPTVNCPYSDSPEMLNMDISVTGTLSKRQGTVIREEFATDPRGFILTTYTLLSGQTLLIMKQGTSLVIYVAPGTSKNNMGRAVEVETFTNVFDSNSASERPTFVWVEGVLGIGDTLIMCCSRTNPILLNVFQEPLTGDGNTTIDKVGNFSGLASTTLSSLIYGDADGTTVEALTNLSYSAPTTTFTFGNNVASGQVGTLVTLSWHWAAEAIKRTRDECYGSAFRFNTSVEADANVEVPIGIQRGLQSDTDSWVEFGYTIGFNNYLATVHAAHDTTGGGFTLANPPTTATEFAWSALSYTDSSDYVTPGTSYLTFGDIAGAGTNPPTPVFWTRIFLLPFNSLQQVDAQDIAAIDNRGNAWTQRTNATRVAGSSSVRDFWLYTSGLVVDTTGGTTDVAAISFQANVPFGVPTDFIEVYYESVAGVGSNASTSYASLVTNGAIMPWYGLSNMCQQFNQEYPSLIGAYQNRIVIGGIPRQPMTLYFSNSGSEGSRFRFQNFQALVFTDPTVATEPITVTLEGREDDRIVGFLGWYDSLFVFTERTVRRIFGGNTVAVSPTNISQTTIAEIGCKSSHGFVATDEAILFISDSGLYAIRTTDTSGGFDAVNIGVKVEQIFTVNSESLPSVSWMYYNQLRDVVFFGLSSEQDAYLNSRLLVYYNRRSAFGEYALYNGYFLTAFGASDSKRDFLCYVQRDTAVTAAPTSSAVVHVLEQNVDDVNIDLVLSPSAASLISTYTTPYFNPRIEHTIDNSQRIIKTTPSEQSGLLTRQAFRSLPLNNFYDYLEVIYDNGSTETELVGGSDFLRYPFQQSIYVNTIPYTTGHTIEINLLDERESRPVVVVEDTIELVEGTDYTIATSSGLFTIDKDDANADSVYYIGTSIPCWHFTPTLLAELPIQMKRGVHYLGYYDNRLMQSYYKASDVNSTVSQTATEVSDRYKTEAGLSIGILYNDARSGVYQLELYGTESLTWDVSQFDLPSQGYRNQLNDVVRLVEPIIGVGYSIQVCNFNFGTERFALIGYKVKQRLKGKNTTRWY